MASLLDLAQARLQGLLDIPTRAARAIVNPTAFSGLLGAPTLPKQQGIAEAAYGLPARQNMSVLDPNQAAYLQGYQQGEPLAYLGMATPFAAPAAVAGAKAVAPKAGMALENYMASQGLLQPLIAYHGTPHTIQGKFDISKVGTGEGAQSYGHGMYFAEAKPVAQQYANKLTEVNGQSVADQLDSRIKYLNSLKEQASLGDLNAKKNIPLIEKSISELQNTGNLYKVDIPDEFIPNMLDWDKPLSEMTKKEAEIIDPLKKMLIESKNPYHPKSFETIGQVIQFSRGANGDLEKRLLDAGFSGIRYLDEGSREVGKGTSNFVVFEPSTVKILEKNSQKVEGLLD